MQINFIPIDYDYFDFQGKNYVLIFGRDDKGKRVALVDEFEPYFWAILKQDLNERKINELRKEIEKIEINDSLRKTKVLKTEVHEKKFLGKDVKALKLFISNYKDAHAIAGKLDFEEIEARREYDINLITRYIIDKKLVPLQWYEVSGETTELLGLNNLEVDFCIKAEKIEKIEKREKDFLPKIVAFDIETDEFEIGKGEILMISLVFDSFKKVLTWKKIEKKEKFERLNFVEFYKDEAEMLEAFMKYIKELEPDILVGYFSDGFDLPYLRARAEYNKIKLAIGLDSSQPNFARGRISSGKICGIIHVDLFRFIDTVYSQYLQSETLGLNDVASELLGEGKKEFAHKHSSKLKEEEWLDYFEYNLQDSVLTYKLAEKFWPDMQEFCRIIQEPLFEITRNSMSQLVEDYVLHHLEYYNEIAEKRPIHDEIGKRREREKYEGAFVLQPRAALYENLAIFDFTSMYASIIVSFNLSLASFSEKKIPNSYEADVNKLVFFDKKPSFFPLMLKDIVEKRKICKQEYKKDPGPITKARSNAYKLIANAAYGYQGFFGARYYCLEAAAATAFFARKFIKDVIDKTNKEGFSVIYADTDGFAFTLNGKSKQEVLGLLKKLNSELPGIMELELEDFYKRGLWVTKRTGDFGAKKKYALITEDKKLKIRGFETVRRDWCDLARALQNKVLQKILEDGNEKAALEITKKTINDLKERKVKIDEIVVRTQLKKPLSEYKSITPHVIAARKMQERGIPLDIGMLLIYFIAETRNKKALVRDRVKLPEEEGDYDLKYYIEHQILSAVENIFQVFKIFRDDILGKKQTRLGEF
jgi:DNA polymerase I/DNA polymerase-2